MSPCLLCRLGVIYAISKPKTQIVQMWALSQGSNLLGCHDIRSGYMRDRLTCTWGPSPGGGPTEAVRDETWLSMLAYMDLRIGETQTPPKLGTCLMPPGIGGSASGICTVCSQSNSFLLHASC